MKLSAVVIAHDEARRIDQCLESLKFADEIVVVVSSQTTDATESLARVHTDRVFVREFRGFSDQRQWADEQARGEWLLSIDCDEIVSAALAGEVRQAIDSPAVDAFRVAHLDYMFGRWIRHGGWYPQYHVRLYRRAASSWQRDIHERVTIRGSVGTLREPIRHFAHGRVDDWVKKMARYTSLEARTRFEAGSRTNILRILAEPGLYAAYKFVWQQGWRDGMHGLVLALLLGAYRLLWHLKLWDLQQSARGPRESDDCPPTSPS